MQGGTKLDRGLVAIFPVYGRQDMTVKDVVNTPTQEEPHENTGRTTRAMARRAGGL